MVAELHISEVIWAERIEMARLDVTRAIEPAFQHMVRVLFRPFVLLKWLALGLVSTFLGYGSSFNIPNFGERDTPQPGCPPEISAWIAQYWPLILLSILVLSALGLLMLWISSVMHMVYVDQITRNSGAIREPFARLRPLGTSYFLWMLAFGLVVTLALGVLITLPLLVVFYFIPQAGIAAKAVVVAWSVLVGLPLIIGAILASIFARDFVVPTMYVRQVRILQAWQIVLPILRANIGQSFLYLLFLIVFGIATGIAAIIVLLVSMMIFAIPAIILAVIGYLFYTAAGPDSIVPLIVLGVIVGIPFLFGFLYFINCALQPAQVFLRSFGLAVLGQADPSLVTIPISTQAQGNQQPSDC